MATMKAVVFKGRDHIAVEQVPKPVARVGEAIVRVTTTTICGADRARALKASRSAPRQG